MSLQSTNSACPVKLLSNQCLLLMLYLPSLASISRQDIAGNSGMEPKGTERLRGIFERKFRCYGLLSVKSSAYKSLISFFASFLQIYDTAVRWSGKDQGTQWFLTVTSSLIRLITYLCRQNVAYKTVQDQRGNLGASPPWCGYSIRRLSPLWRS